MCINIIYIYIYIIPIFCRLPLEITFWDVLATSRFVDGQKTDFHENVGFIQRNSANGQNNGLLLVFHAVMIGLKSSTTPWRNFTGSYSFTFNYLYCLFESALFARIMTPFHVPKKLLEYESCIVKEVSQTNPFKAVLFMSLNRLGSCFRTSLEDDRIWQQMRSVIRLKPWESNHPWSVPP
jgi:hypothetical protein